MPDRDAAVWNTVRPADAVEADPAHEGNVFAVATYELTAEGTPEEARHGTVHILRCEPGQQAPELLKSTETVGVFDLKWHSTPGRGFAVAGADGCGYLYSSAADGELKQTLRVGEPTKGEFCLSVGWSGCGERLACGTRAGQLAVYDIA
eukprot:Hpha_TRINITY_DN27793_c0_g1::TRINITY_DN27793_c0_g1_i1::g.157081::m.157081